MKNNNLTIELWINEEDCTGCTACFCKCPKGAINMVENNEGFLYPIINQQLCIKCGLCIKVCPLKK